MKKTNKIKNYSLKAKLAKKKKVKGFTLVELIVVIAIIGVLAVVLVPNMMKYVKNARLTTENDAAAKIADQANLIAADLEAQGMSLSGSYSTDISFKSGEHATDFASALNKAVPIPAKTAVAIHFGDNGQVDAVVYKAEKSDYIGLYPNPSDRDGSSKSAKDMSEAIKLVNGITAVPTPSGGTTDDSSSSVAEQ